MNFNIFASALIRSLRPRQWIKNLALFAGLVFSGALDERAPLILAIYGFSIFCAASSATYLLNDVFDIDRDKKHPLKRNRPIAAGIIPAPFAIALASLIIILILPLSYILSTSFFLAVVGYLMLQVLYSAYLKSLMLIDIMAIATGFVLRVYAGVWIIGAHLNVWFLLTVIPFALFLAIGKRRSELTLLKSHASQHRETLSHYPETLLDILTAMFANSTWLAYAIFTSLQPQLVARPRLVGLLESLDLPFIRAKFLMITIPVVLYGVMRYLYIIYEKKEGESPEKVLIKDKPLLATVILWLILVIMTIYYIGT
jgi:4-hydroxybenzoate polyprenyltransferase